MVNNIPSPLSSIPREETPLLNEVVINNELPPTVQSRIPHLPSSSIGLLETAKHKLKNKEVIVVIFSAAMGATLGATLSPVLKPLSGAAGGIVGCIVGYLILKTSHYAANRLGCTQFCGERI